MEITPLVKPTKKILLEVIAKLEKSSQKLCCRNCYETSDYPLCCDTCGIFRCEKCRPIYRRNEISMITYGILELGLSPIILETILRIYHVDVESCEGCFNKSCSRSGCSKMTYYPCTTDPHKNRWSEPEWWCENCTYVCEKCSKKCRYGDGIKPKLCKKCRPRKTKMSPKK